MWPLPGELHQLPQTDSPWLPPSAQQPRLVAAFQVLLSVPAPWQNRRHIFCCYPGGYLVGCAVVDGRQGSAARGQPVFPLPAFLLLLVWGLPHKPHPPAPSFGWVDQFCLCVGIKQWVHRVWCFSCSLFVTAHNYLKLCNNDWNELIDQCWWISFILKMIKIFESIGMFVWYVYDWHSLVTYSGCPGVM